MADDEPVRRASVFVNDDEVCDPVGSAGGQQLVELIVATIQTLGVGNDQPKLFNKLFQGRRWVS